MTSYSVGGRTVRMSHAGYGNLWPHGGTNVPLYVPEDQLSARERDYLHGLGWRTVTLDNSRTSSNRWGWFWLAPHGF